MKLTNDDILFINKFCSAIGYKKNITITGPETAVLYDWKFFPQPTEVCIEDVLAYISELPVFYDYTYDDQLTVDDMERMLGLIRVALGWDRFDIAWDISLMPEDYGENHYFKESLIAEKEYAPYRKESGLLF